MRWDMANKWALVSLGEICDFRAGTAFKPTLQGRLSGDYPFVKVSDMNLPENIVRIQVANNWVSADDLGELRAKPLPPGTVVFAKIGEALRQNRLRGCTISVWTICPPSWLRKVKRHVC
jgi:type I restriction enzyme S subunit